MRLIVSSAAFAIALGAAAIASNAGAQADAPPSAAERSGEELYTQWCADCHDPGPGHPATMRMEGDFGAENSVLLEMQGMNRPLIELAVRRGFAMMPPFRPTEISDEELERIADYVLGEEQ